MEKRKTIRERRENLRFLRNCSLCAGMAFLGGTVFPVPSMASVSTELAVNKKQNKLRV